jgi:hypothetical protein
MRSQTRTAGIVYPYVPDQSSKTKFSRKPSDSHNDRLWNERGAQERCLLQETVTKMSVAGATPIRFGDCYICKRRSPSQLISHHLKLVRRAQ